MVEKNERKKNTVLHKIFSLVFVGDADRVAFFAANGEYLNCSLVGAMIAKNIIQQHPKEQLTFIYNVFNSRIFEETVVKYGGKLERSRVGHAFVKEQMKAHDAAFSCENSGHFYFRDNFYADSGVLCLLQIASAFAKSLAEGHTFLDMFAEFMKYHQTEEKVVFVDKARGIQLIEERYCSKQLLYMEKFDGLSVRVSGPPEYWFTVKDSVTEDALKVVVEAEQKDVAEAAKAEILQLLECLGC